jgi:hypothetical protein
MYKIYNDYISIYLQNIAPDIRISYGEVNKVLSVIIIQKAYRKLSVGQHGPPTKAKVGSGAMGE